jgi:hypothetical protein
MERPFPIPVPEFIESNLNHSFKVKYLSFYFFQTHFMKKIFFSSLTTTSEKERSRQSYILKITIG